MRIKKGMRLNNMSLAPGQVPSKMDKGAMSWDVVIATRSVGDYTLIHTYWGEGPRGEDITFLYRGKVVARTTAGENIGFYLTTKGKFGCTAVPVRLHSLAVAYAKKQGWLPEGWESKK